MKSYAILPLLPLILLLCQCSPADSSSGEKLATKARPTSVAEPLLNGPDYAPPFEIKKAERIEGELRVTSFLDTENKSQPEESATLIFGNKRIAVRESGENKMGTKRDNVITILINENPVFKFILVSNYRDKDGNNIPMTGIKEKDRVNLVTDTEAKAIRWSSRYPLPDGRETEFSYTLQPVGPSKVRLSWDIGCSAEQVAEYRQQGHTIGGHPIYFDIPGNYRAEGLIVNGAAIEPKPVELLKQYEQEKLEFWQGHLKELTYSPDKPLYGFTLSSEGGLKGNGTEIYHYKRVDLGFQFVSDQEQDSVVIDFGEVASPDKDAPPPVEGHDLWAQDALHIPLSPTRNLFPNSSFEQGLLYWRWFSGGAHYTRSDVLRYEVDRENGRFGKQAMVINPVQETSAPLRSFSLPSAKGKTYTVSFYAKAENEGAHLKLAPYSSKSGGQFTRQAVWNFKNEILSPEWTRYSYSFLSDGAPVSFVLTANGRKGKIWLDGIQVEVGKEVSEFVTPPLEGELSTSHNENNVEYGDPIQARFAVRGKAGTKGTLELELRDFYQQTVWSQKFDTHAGETLDLPWDQLDLGTGVYYLQTHFVVEDAPAYDAYYRFTIIDSLEGTHATKELYGALVSCRINRTEEELELMKRLGFVGSTSYGSGKLADPLLYEIREKFNITDYTHEVTGCPHLTAEQKNNRHPDYLFSMSINTRNWRRPEERKVIPEWETYSDEVLKRFEELSEKVARECPYVRVWAIATEEEGTIPPLKKNRDFKEFAKLQEAFYRGIKKGNPDALVLPSGGTSGYGETRGKDDIEGYLRETQGKIKWDAVAVHPYGSIDGTLGAGDLDESLQMLSESMARYGYGEETPIILNEGGGGSSNIWGDGPSWSYNGGQPSYDQGLHEFLHASKMARQYIICLKYWPRVPHYNTWQHDERRIVDYNLTPDSFLLGMNTLGHLLGNPKFIGDVRPAAGVRGYAFEDTQNGGVAAVWCTIDDVERGFIRGPVMRVRFDGELPEMVDLMGRSQPLTSVADGVVDIQLTPAPLFLTSQDPQALAKALQSAEIIGAGSNVEVEFRPTLSGEVVANIKNLTSREQSGSLEIDGKSVSFAVSGSQTQAFEVEEGSSPVFGKIYDWNKDYVLKQPEADPFPQQWKMEYLYVPKVNGTPNWSKIPAIPVTNVFRPVINLKQTPGGDPGDQTASFQMAWDTENLYLRVEAEDDTFDLKEERFWSSEVSQEKALYMLDGCLEVYFDCGANGRMSNQGYDLDDYRYDFSAGNPEGQSGPGKVYRFQEVFQEFAGGVEFPTKAEAAKGIQCEFTRISPTRFAYTITFAQKYVAPLKLTEGTMAGFGLYLHDRMDDGTMGNKGLSLATEPGAHCDRNPRLWPLMILSE